jgi:hypothetical protein
VSANAAATIPLWLVALVVLMFLMIIMMMIMMFVLIKRS